MTNPDDAIILPSVPESPKRHAFPYLATIAPVVASLVIWLVTRSPFALVFALIGPVVALASVGDSVRRARGERRRASVRFESELVAAIHAVGEAHSREREALEREAPRAAAIVADPVRNPERWRATLSAPLPVRLGTGNLPSGIRVERRDSAIASPRECAELDRLMESASEIDRAPITVDSRFGVGVVGPMPHVHALANSLVIQLANALSPAEFELVHAAHPASGEGWHELLPHWSAPVERAVQTHADVDSSAKVGRSRTEFRPRAGGEGVVVATGSHEQDLPAECRIVVRLGGARARLARHPDVASSSSAETGRPVPRATQRDREGPRDREFAPDFLSDRQARAFAERLSDAARELVRCRQPELPHSVALSDLVQPADEGRTRLSACIGIGSRGDVVVDLASDGPHAIVGGTTGSGKSELLLTWILAMAAAHGPNDVNFLLVDFKGGAAFDAVSTLPHTVGVVTDLDGPLANRAILSLKAELRRRERLLASVPARSIEELDGSVMLARLVIVVDEFATLAGALPELHDVFVDLAARGRSLGIHLILCTQRPAASIRETVMANCSLRMSLRVTNQADSIAVVGVSDAAKLPRHPIGRAILASGDDEPDVVQLARSVAGDAAAIARSPASSVTSVHRPWLDPLPGLVLPREVPDAAAPAISFGITDIPDEQRRGIAVYDPRAHGNVLVLGGLGTGKSTALATLARRAGDALAVPSDVEGAWDAVEQCLDRARKEHSRALVVIDDIDHLVARMPADHESAFIERLTRLAREGPRAGMTLALSAGSARGRVQSIAALCDSTLLLRLPSREDHVLAGGKPNEFLANMPPGGGYWQGHRVHVAFAEAVVPRTADPVPELVQNPETPLIIVSTAPSAIRRALGELGAVTVLGSSGLATNELVLASESTILLGDPDAWINATGVIHSLKSRARIAFHACGVGDIRSIARSRDMPPPVSDDSTTLLIVNGESGRFSRARLPA